MCIDVLQVIFVSSRPMAVFVAWVSSCAIQEQANILCVEKIPGRTTTLLPNQPPLLSYILLDPNLCRFSRIDSTARRQHICGPFDMALGCASGDIAQEAG